MVSGQAYAPIYDGRGIGEQAYSALEEGVGYEAGALAATGVTIVQLSGKGSAAAALKALRIAIKR